MNIIEETVCFLFLTKIIKIQTDDWFHYYREIWKIIWDKKISASVCQSGRGPTKPHFSASWALMTIIVIFQAWQLTVDCCKSIMASHDAIHGQIHCDWSHLRYHRRPTSTSAFHFQFWRERLHSFMSTSSLYTKLGTLYTIFHVLCSQIHCCCW